jgi:hypothetical protein
MMLITIEVTSPNGDISKVGSVHVVNTQALEGANTEYAIRYYKVEDGPRAPYHNATTWHKRSDGFLKLASLVLHKLEHWS